MASAAPEEPVDPADELMFLCLGGGNEVGRSCHIIQYKGKTVMVRRQLRRHRVVPTDTDCLHHSLMRASILPTTALPLSPSSTTSISAR
jgi:hypothetical protein